MWRRVAPSARRKPISPRRSSTEITMMLAIPIAPTINATAPSPSSSVVKCPLAAARASSTFDGRLTWTPSGFWGPVVGEQVRHLRHVVDVGADVDLRGIRRQPEQPLGHRQPDEDIGVQRRIQHNRLEDPHDGEPGAAVEKLDVNTRATALKRSGSLGPKHD